MPPLPLTRPPPPHRHCAQVRLNLDYKDTTYLMQTFVTEAGRLKSRKHTQLPPLLHVRSMRAVKLARQLALIPYEMQFGDEVTDGPSAARLRMFEAAKQQYRLKDGGERRPRGERRRGAAQRQEEAQQPQPQPQQPA